MIKITFNITDQETLENYRDIHEDLIISDFINNPKTWINIIDQIKVVKTNIDAKKYIIKFIEEIHKQYPDLPVDYEYEVEDDNYKIWHTDIYVEFKDNNFPNFIGGLIKSILFKNNVFNFSFGYNYEKDKNQKIKSQYFGLFKP